MSHKENLPSAPVWCWAAMRRSDGRLLRGAGSRGLNFSSEQLCRTAGRPDPAWEMAALLKIVFSNHRMHETIIDVIDMQPAANSGKEK